MLFKTTNATLTGNSQPIRHLLTAGCSVFSGGCESLSRSRMQHPFFFIMEITYSTPRIIDPVVPGTSSRIHNPGQAGMIYAFFSIIREI
ncbi:hypothetical protein CPB86DRAFT_149597 [Serendipita vermifera]|nr:hypothetical protein CPB86DRAFT_149597 [Serendipita vermifera]